MRKLVSILLLLVVFSGAGLSGVSAATSVPGHQRERYDQDSNGYSDTGVYVNGHYESIYAYDGDGDWYWDLGDGRIQGSVGDIALLDQDTVTTCDYVINYRADFGNNAYMDTGWIQNLINCSGYDDNGQYNYLIVHQDDPRYTGNPDNAIWGTWEYVGYMKSGLGNIAKNLREAI